MKTKNFKMATKIIAVILVLFAMQLSATAEISKKKSKRKEKNQVQPDTTSYVSIEGEIKDIETNKPLVFANVFLDGANVATVSNLEGEFIIKVPKKVQNGKLKFSYIGYKNKTVLVSSLDQRNNTIKLEPKLVPLEEVTIRPGDPFSLVKGALNNISENYSENPAMLTSFYRETIKQNRSYVAVSEGVLDVYKAPYVGYKRDLIKVFKGRKSTDVKRMDTLIFKLQGGPNTTLLLDVVKNPDIFLSYDFLKYYDFELIGIVNVNNKQNYVIQFTQNNKIEYPLYNGKIYLDIKNLAFTGLEFNLNLDNIDEASKLFVKKKPGNMKITPQIASYMVNYREKDGKWHLNYMRAEVKFKVNWKKKLFNSIYTTMSEMAITDRDTENINKFKLSESAKPTDIFVEKVSSFEDNNFWGDYNYIKPDESIESAIKKLSRKLKRK